MLPAPVGRPAGGSRVVVALSVFDSGRVFPVALSKSDQDARYVTGAGATPAGDEP